MHLTKTKIFQNRLHAALFFVGLPLNIILWLIIFIYVKPVVEPIPLHYNIYFGIDLLDYWYKFFYLPAVGLIILAGNLILSAYLSRHDDLIAYFFIISAGAIQLILILASVLIINYWLFTP